MYFETGAIPLRYIISRRRLLYLQTILQRPDEELTKRILIAQKKDPSPGDFVNLVEEDFNSIEEKMSYEVVERMAIGQYKSLIKKKTADAAFKHLKTLQKTHSKIKDIEYKEFNCQPYIQSPIFTNRDVNLLHSLRSRSVDCKVNFKGQHGDDLSCPFCQGGHQDDQPHMLDCPKLREKIKSKVAANSAVIYSDLFGDLHKQKEATELFSILIDMRKEMLDIN